MEHGLFRCASCKATLDCAADAAIVCGTCGARYPIEASVPVLLKDHGAHVQEIAAAQQANPEWYVAAQPPEEASPWRHHLRKRRQYVEAVLKRELERRGWRKAPRLLDLGCGDGNNLLWLGAYAERLYGSDYNPVRTARARARCPDATVYMADLLEYPTVDDAFDVIFFNHVIEHIPEDMLALETVWRILKPGGLLILGTPNEGAWWWQLAYKRSPEIRATTDHVHFYTAGTIEAKMRAAGLAVTEIEHLGWGPPDWELDGRWRQHKWVDDLFERVGRSILRSQASSLYLIATK